MSKIQERTFELHEVYPFRSVRGKTNWQGRFKAARETISMIPGALKGIPAGLLKYSPRNRSQPTTAEKKRRRRRNR